MTSPLASAKASRGTLVPTANATVRTTADSPTRWVAPTTVMAARIGPAHGTYTSPRPRPRTNPPAALVGRRAPSRENGRSSSRPSGGIR